MAVVKYAEGTIPGSADWVREEVSRVLRGQNPGKFVWVKDVFPTNVIVEFEDLDYDMPLDAAPSEKQMYSYSYEVVDDSVTVGDWSEVKLDYVAKMRRQFSPKPIGKRPVEGAIVKKDEEHHLVYAAVLVPGEVDKNGERPLSEEEVYKYAHGYMKNFRYMDTNHDFQVGAGVPVESWVTKEAMDVEINGVQKTLRKGSWVIGSEPDSETWRGIESGEITGYSITGIPQKTLDMATKSEDVAFKALLLEDLESPVIGIVSYVKNPAVGDAQFFAKKEEATKAERRSFWEAIGLVRSNKENDSAKDEEDNVAGKNEGVEITLDSLTTSMKGAFKEALVEGGLIKEEPAEQSDTEKILSAINGLAQAISGQKSTSEEENSGESGTANKEQGGSGSEGDGSPEQDGSAEKSAGEAGRQGSDAEGVTAEKSEVEKLRDEIAQKDELLGKAAVALKRAGTGSKIIEDAQAVTPSTESTVSTKAGVAGAEKIERDAYGRRIRA